MSKLVRYLTAKKLQLHGVHIKNIRGGFPIISSKMLPDTSMECVVRIGFFTPNKVTIKMTLQEYNAIPPQKE